MNRIIWVLVLVLSCVVILATHQTIQAAVMAQQAGTSTQTPSSTTVNPALTATPTPTYAPTATTTLVPLPAITLIFPAPTETSTPTITPDSIVITETPNPADGVESSPLSPRLKVLIGLIIVLWVFLIGFIVLYIRQLR